MTDKSLILDNGFSKDLLAQLPELDADSPLRNIDTTESKMTFLPKFSVNMMNQFVMKLKDGAVKLPETTIPAVIHHFHPDLQRVYYANPFDPKNPTAPDCGSNDGISPDESASTPQHTRCDTCPNKADRSCKLKQRIIVSQKVEGGEPQLMAMDLNVTSVLDRSGEPNGYFGFKALTQNIAKVNKNIYNFVIQMHIDPEARCKVQFKPIDAISDEKDPNMVAHVKYKEQMDFTELCKMDFAPWGGKDEDSQVDKAAPETKLNAETTKKSARDAAPEGGAPEVKASTADVKDWLKKDK